MGRLRQDWSYYTPQATGYTGVVYQSAVLAEDNFIHNKDANQMQFPLTYIPYKWQVFLSEGTKICWDLEASLLEAR